MASALSPVADVTHPQLCAAGLNQPKNSYGLTLVLKHRPVGVKCGRVVRLTVKAASHATHTLTQREQAHSWARPAGPCKCQNQLTPPAVCVALVFWRGLWCGVSKDWQWHGSGLFSPSHFIHVPSILGQITFKRKKPFVKMPSKTKDNASHEKNFVIHPVKIDQHLWHMQIW